MEETGARTSTRSAEVDHNDIVDSEGRVVTRARGILNLILMTTGIVQGQALVANIRVVKLILIL